MIATETGAATDESFILLHGCPHKAVTPLSAMLVELAAHYGNHFLPFPGGVYNQPHLIMEGITIVTGERARLQREEQEAQDRRLGR